MPAEMPGIPAPIPPKPVETSVVAPEPSPADWAAPNSLAAVLTARAALAVLPVVKSLDSMLIGIVAIRKGVLKLFSIDSDDVEDDDDDESVADDVRLAKLCGDARLCRIWGIPEISCGPDDMSVCTSVAPDALAAWAVAAVCAASPPGLVVCGAVVNGVTCEAVAEALA